jgi:glycolate oxidase iron-sulfur subunit
MAFYDLLENVEEEISKCMKCGNCQAVCPIYSEVLGEEAVARGKIVLAQALINGEIEYTKKMDEIFSLCLTCQACADNCPCGVRADKIVLGTRAAIIRKRGLHPLKRRIFDVLSKPKIFRLGMNMGSSFQGMGFKKVKDNTFMKPRFPIGLDMRRIIPPLKSKSLISEMPRVNKAKSGKPKYKAAFFTGCMMNFIYTEAGKAVVDVLTENNVEVVIPKEQHCCGTPVFINGDWKIGKEIAKYNIDVFLKEDYDAVITHCGTGIDAWRIYYPEMLEDDPEYSEKAEILAEKTFDVTEFLVDKIGFRKPEANLDVRVTYHDPCHMVRGVGVSEQPREIIKAIPGVDFVEMEKPDRCCGSAGSFSLTHYKLSSQIRDKKIKDILSVKPDVVATSCGACRMQIEDGLYQADADIPVKHTVMLLSEAYAKEKKLERAG